MARVAINTGSIANDGTGDTLRAAGGIINSNFSDIYNYFGDGTNLNFSGGNWEVTAVGINTLSSVGIGTTNPRFALEVGAVGASGTSLWVNGNARVTGILTVGTASITLDGSSNTISVGSGVTINGSTGIIDATSIVVGGTTLTGAAVTRIEAGTGISVDQNTGQVTITATGGGGESYWSQNATGINTTSNVGIGTTTASSALTVQGDVLVSGVSTFGAQVNINTGGSSKLNIGAPNDLYLQWDEGSQSASLDTSATGNLYVQNNANGGIFLNAGTSNHAGVHLYPSDRVELRHAASKKFETLGAGVTVTGTTFTNQLSVSGVSTLGIVTGATYYGDASNAADGRWTLGANGTSDYTFTGIGFTQTTNDPVLYLARGRVYEFVNNSGGAHPFEIRVSNGGAAYSDGVTNNAAATGVIRFEIPFNAPNTLYYQCTVHSGMGNTISVYPNTI